MNLASQLKTLPRKPGVYLFQDAKGRILYVGKAKILAHRVRSYFRAGAALDPAKQQMVPQIVSVTTIATDTETEALVLEANLIRQHQPPYNVVLRDDKYYLFIKITTGEEFPRVFPVRRVKRDGGRYFGPYSSAQAVRATLRLLRRLFPHKGEKESPRETVFPHPLFASDAKSAPRNSASWRSEVGLPQEQYHLNIQNIIRFLKGHREAIITTLRTGMQAASRAHEFERAAVFRNQLQALERLEGTQKVFLLTKESFDVVSLARSGNKSAANIFQIRGGKLLSKQTFLLQHRASVPSADTLRQFVLQYYSVAQDIPKTIFIPEALSDQTELANWINKDTPPQILVPQRGKKRQLLKMGELNAQQLLTQEAADFESEVRLKNAMEELFEALNLQPHFAPPAGGASRGDSPQRRIETYDISNIQGQLATASMVVFENGKPAPSQYRKFKLRQQTPAGLAGNNQQRIDDYTAIQEALHRRFSARHTAWHNPDLIIIDGGKGQLSAAQTVLKELKLDIPVISLAKRLEEIYTPGKKTPLQLPYDSDALYLIQRMRDEAHRFTLTYHKLLRSHQATRSLLDDIPGIGPKTKRLLLNRFGSLKGIRAASIEELAKALGKKKAALLRDYI